MTKAHWVALASVPGVGGKTVTRLLAHFGSVSAIFAASTEELAAVPRLATEQAQTIASLSLEPFEARIADYEAAGIRLITWEESAYPANLLLINDAPPLLLVRGDLLPADNRAVAIVGTREPRPVSADLAYELAAEFARCGWTVVSGLALGIDAAAHRGTLSEGGRTLAVLGSGVDTIYPRNHTKLAKAISEQGAVLSEVLPEARVSRQTLLARNRLTSGLSRAVIVVQSSADSGSAHTARRALEQGRLVLAITNGQDDHLLAAGAEALDPTHIDVGSLCDRLDSSELNPQPGEPTQPRLF
jgi:DNA processing protein